jgi:hypothetical protein
MIGFIADFLPAQAIYAKQLEEFRIYFNDKCEYSRIQSEWHKELHQTRVHERELQKEAAIKQEIKSLIESLFKDMDQTIPADELSLETVNKIFRKWALNNHPDKSDDGSKKVAKQFSAAQEKRESLIGLWSQFPHIKILIRKK